MHNHTPEQLSKYWASEKSGTFQTPEWRTMASENDLTPAGTEHAMRGFAHNRPRLENTHWDPTLCEVCGRAGPLPYRDCRGCSNVCSWHRGKLCKGGPVFQVNATRQQERCYENAFGTTYHPAALPDLAIGHPWSVETTSGNVVPLREREDAYLIKYGDEDIIKLAVQHGLNSLPEHLDQAHVMAMQAYMQRHGIAR